MAPRTKVKNAKSGEQVALTIAVPGGMAEFYSPVELPPRRAREIEVRVAVLAPKLRRLAVAQQIIRDGEIVAEDEGLDGIPEGLSFDESRQIAELSDVVTWAYLRSWKVRPDRDLPTEPDALLDLPRPLYKAVTEHAAKVHTSGDTGGFGLDALPDDEGDQADTSLPTSASGA